MATVRCSACLLVDVPSWLEVQVDEPSAATNDIVVVLSVEDFVVSVFVLPFSVDFPLLLLLLIRGSVFLFPPFSVDCGAGILDSVANALLPLLRLPIAAGVVAEVVAAVVDLLLGGAMATRTRNGTSTDVGADAVGTKESVLGSEAAILLFSSCACSARCGVEEVTAFDLFRFVFLVDDIVV